MFVQPRSKTNDNLFIALGILIAGGSGTETSTEVFLPGNGKTCALADLPDERYGHTLDTLRNTAVLCGGRYTGTSCLQFSQDIGIIIIYSSIYTGSARYMEQLCHYTRGKELSLQLGHHGGNPCPYGWQLQSYNHRDSEQWEELYPGTGYKVMILIHYV